MFDDIPERREVHAHVATKNDEQKSRDRSNRNEDQFRRTMIRYMLDRPEACRNCIATTHKLPECPNIKKEARDNLAAWYVEDYEEQTKATRPYWLKQHAKRYASRE